MSVSGLAATAVALICAVGWLKWRISALALIHYMKTKGYAAPSDAEIQESTGYVVKKLFIKGS